MHINGSARQTQPACGQYNAPTNGTISDQKLFLEVEHCQYLKWSIIIEYEAL